MIATQGVVQAEPDGYTILFGTTGNLAVNPVLYAGRPGMDMAREFTPLTIDAIAFPCGADDVLLCRPPRVALATFASVESGRCARM